MKYSGQKTGIYASRLEFRWANRFVAWGWPFNYIGDTTYWADFHASVRVQEIIVPDGVSPGSWAECPKGDTITVDCFIEVKPLMDGAIENALERMIPHVLRPDVIALIVEDGPDFETWYTVERSNHLPCATSVDRPKSYRRGGKIVFPSFFEWAWFQAKFYTPPFSAFVLVDTGGE